MAASDTGALEQATQSPAGSEAPVGQAVAGCPKPCKSSCPREPSKAEYQSLRGGTPSDEMQKAVNSKNPKTCGACGNVVASLAADHIVSLKIISQMPGFACLTKEDQLDVANSPRNFMGLCGPCNSSKCAKTWHRWKGVKGKPEVSADVRTAARQQTNQQMKELKAKVRKKPCKQ
jgi:5-methylcytosine-specific restriction endonuclease McrA